MKIGDAAANLFHSFMLFIAFSTLVNFESFLESVFSQADQNKQGYLYVLSGFTGQLVITGQYKGIFLHVEKD